MIKEMFEEVLQEENSKAIILEIYKTGSQIFKDDPNDLDYVAICRGYTPMYSRRHKDVDGKTYDLIIKDEQEILKSLSFSKDNEGIFGTVLYNYFICFRDTVYGSWDFEWDMLNHKEKYLQYLNQTYFNSIGKRINRNKLTKAWVHYYIVLKIYENQSIEITDEMKTDINILYNASDGSQLPIIDWIEEKLAE